MVDLSLDSDPDFTALYDLLGLKAPFAKSDAITGFDAVSDAIALSASDDSTALDALTALDVLAAPFTSALLSEDPMPLRRCGQSDHQNELQDIVDGLFR